MKKVKKIYKKSRRKVTEYLSTNRLFLSFVIIVLIQTTLFRYLTLESAWSLNPIVMDLALILLIGSLGYLVKPKNQFTYFFIWLLIFTFLVVINSIYYTFYVNFVSFGMLATLPQVFDVMDSLVEKLEVLDFVYILGPIIFYYIHRKLNKTNYYNYVAKIERGKKMCISTALAGVIFIASMMVTWTNVDYSRLGNQWNREFIVGRFGIIMYQGNDLVQTLMLRINSLFGYDEAVREFREFYANLDNTHTPNRYTGILEGKNIIFIHMESMQTFVMDLKFNGREVTPNMNRLAAEGMFFSRFYPQISTGTSSDTEFTILTSLMPALSGTVFISYNDREFLTIPKILAERGYWAFSMHGNKASMWGRDRMHPRLGFDHFFASTYFNTTRENMVGRLGIGDEAFFEQAMPILIDIEREHENYFGKILTLSHHSPFDDLEGFGEFDLSATVQRLNERTGEMETVVDPFLEGRRMGNYIKSAAYADRAMGQFFDAVRESDYFNNTVFVLYGDHDARLARSEFYFLYNYDPELGRLRTPEDEGYVVFDAVQHELNKNTPLIFWTKNEDIRRQLNGNFDYVMGMYDVLPTLGNMMVFYSPFAMGRDIFDVRENNIVIFPNGNFLTRSIYYFNASGEFISLDGNPIDLDYIEFGRRHTTDRLRVSNHIIVFDLIRREGNRANYSEVEIRR